MSNIIITTKEDLAEVFLSVLQNFEKEKANKGSEKLYCINQVAKRLGRAHLTIKKAVKSGTIRSTKDGLIPESAIEEYLNSK